MNLKNKKYQRTVLILNILNDTFSGIFRMGVAIIGKSFFVLLNGIISVSFGISRINILAVKSKSKQEQVKIYLFISKTIMLMSILQAIYSMRLFFVHENIEYPMEIALLIALYTFTEFFIIVRELVLLRNKDDLVDEALKFTDLSSIITFFILTQTAILSFSYIGDANLYNAFSGLFFGLMMFIIGLFMCHRGKTRNSIQSINK